MAIIIMSQAPSKFLQRQVMRNNQRAKERRQHERIKASEWRAICASWQDRCACCHTLGHLSIDHIKPLSRGGKNLARNVQPLCMDCNTKKDRKEIKYVRGLWW